MRRAPASRASNLNRMERAVKVSLNCHLIIWHFLQLCDEEVRVLRVLRWNELKWNEIRQDKMRKYEMRWEKMMCEKRRWDKKSRLKVRKYEMSWAKMRKGKRTWEEMRWKMKLILRFPQISTSACWEPATAEEGSAASTPRARSVARERSAVGRATNSLTTTTAKVSWATPSQPPFVQSANIHHGFLKPCDSCGVFTQTSMSARPESITVAKSLRARTPRALSAVSRRSSVAQVLYRMPWEAASVSGC